MNREVRVADVTLKRQDKNDGALSFKEKLELSKLLDRMGAAVIEIEGIENPKVDALRIKSIAAAVKNSTVAVPVLLDRANVEAVWNALSGAKSPRLQVSAAVSPMQMEYIFHKKPAAMLEAIADTVRCCAEKTDNVEFIADDAARSDESFLYAALNAAIEAGASNITHLFNAQTGLHHRKPGVVGAGLVVGRGLLDGGQDLVSRHPVCQMGVAQIQQIRQLMVPGIPLAGGGDHHHTAVGVGQDDVPDLFELTGSRHGGAPEFDYLQHISLPQRRRTARRPPF